MSKLSVFTAPTQGFDWIGLASLGKNNNSSRDMRRLYFYTTSNLIILDWKNMKEQGWEQRQGDQLSNCYSHPGERWQELNQENGNGDTPDGCGKGRINTTKWLVECGGGKESLGGCWNHLLRQRDQKRADFFKGITFRLTDFEVLLDIQIVKSGRHFDIEERCSKESSVSRCVVYLRIFSWEMTIKTLDEMSLFRDNV